MGHYVHSQGKPAHDARGMSGTGKFTDQFPARSLSVRGKVPCADYGYEIPCGKNLFRIIRTAHEQSHRCVRTLAKAFRIGRGTDADETGTGTGSSFDMPGGLVDFLLTEESAVFAERAQQLVLGCPVH